MDLVETFPPAYNERIRSYAPESSERESLLAALDKMRAELAELPMHIGGEEIRGGRRTIDVVEPHDHQRVLAHAMEATSQDVRDAISAALEAAPRWRAMSFAQRAGIFLKAAALLSGPWRDRMNAATMLGQSKTVHQSEIDAVCELADFWRFNVANASSLFGDQVNSPTGEWNRIDYRPLEGFVLAVSPFNFTSIAANLATAPALMGNTIVWKPSPEQQLAASVTMDLLHAAGLPRGVINLVSGSGAAVSEVALTSEHLAGIHFTGSTRTFDTFWTTVGRHVSSYRSYPRLVGETGGKDFVVAHQSADIEALRVALIRGAFEYQGQKCSAASRTYVSRTVWDRLAPALADGTDSLAMGDPRDFGNFMGAVISRDAFKRHRAVLESAAGDSSVDVLAGGTCDDSRGYFVRPTVLVGSDPHHPMFRDEYFGPILSVFVFDDSDYTDVLRMIDAETGYGLTGAVFASDAEAVQVSLDELRFTAGNVYVNDKPTGAVVMAQPFGGGRRSGTNDKAGSKLNLSRWTSARAIKEVFVPPTAVGYPHMAES